MKKIICTCLLASGLCIYSAQTNSGLVADYPFNGNANDMSGNNNHGVVNGATLTTGHTGIANSAYHFNGAGQYIFLANASSLNHSRILP